MVFLPGRYRWRVSVEILNVRAVGVKGGVTGLRGVVGVGNQVMAVHVFKVSLGNGPHQTPDAQEQNMPVHISQNEI